MLVSHQHKFIFFKPMKCAGTSVEHALYNIAGEDAICAGSSWHGQMEYAMKNNDQKMHTHGYPDYFYKNIPDVNQCSDYSHITVVRNPWDMIISYYWWVVQRPNFYTQMGGQEYWERCLITGNEPPSVRRLKCEQAMTTAAGYDSCPLAQDLGFADAVSSSFIYISMINSKFLDSRIDHYLRYENLQGDYEQLCKNLGVESVALPHHKHGVRKLGLHYSEYFTDWMRDEVEYYFSDYIEKFGYEFENGV